MFKYVIEDNPDLFIWLGDFAYVEKNIYCKVDSINGV